MRKGQGMAMIQSFYYDEAGAIVSIEIILIITIAVLALIVGWSEIAVAVNTELNDISNAVGALNQSFAFTGFHDNVIFGGNKNISVYAGSSFTDRIDDCDLNLSCDLVCGYQNNTSEL
jgi:Flp pilus assembly pilin Flp